MFSSVSVRNPSVSEKCAKIGIVEKMFLSQFQPGQKIGDRWEVIGKIRDGAYGSEYEVKDVEDKSETKRMALKAESKSQPATEMHLVNDYRILNMLKKRESEQSSLHFCELFNYGETHAYKFMVTSMVGQTVEELLQNCDGQFTPRTAVHLSINSLQAIATLHSVNYLHCTVNPGSLAIGRPPNYRSLYLLDLGRARFFRHEDGHLRRPRPKTDFKGTLRYASSSAHKGEEMTRKDDLWSWLYVTIEMFTGTLFWSQPMQEMKQLEMKDQIERIGCLKEKLNEKPTILLFGCPCELMKVLEMIKSLTYYADPDYGGMVALLQQVEERRRQPNKDGDVLDWEPNGAKHEKVYGS